VKSLRVEDKYNTNFSSLFYVIRIQDMQVQMIYRMFKSKTRTPIIVMAVSNTYVRHQHNNCKSKRWSNLPQHQLSSFVKKESSFSRHSAW